MTLGAHLRKVLLDTTAVADLIGDKISPQINDIDVVPPMAIYMETDTDPISDFGGEVGESFTTVEFCILSKEHDNALAIKNCMWQALKNYSGVAHGCTIKEITRVNDLDGGWDEEDETFRRILIVRVYHTDPLPIEGE